MKLLAPPRQRPIIQMMPPTRGHDLKHNTFVNVEPILADAPHTGARLETRHPIYQRSWSPDAPHTGARLETVALTSIAWIGKMPPTRGHDLKHDLLSAIKVHQDAPHTGARLETISKVIWIETGADAPHTGARLETAVGDNYTPALQDAPHTGARLET